MTNNNILLITDYDDVANAVINKLILLRGNDKITVCDSSNAKKIIETDMYDIAILHQSEDANSTIKMLKTLKELKTDIEIIMLFNSKDKDLTLECYDNGAYDYFFVDSTEDEMLIKTINCFKLKTQQQILLRNEKFLYQFGIIDDKTSLYKYKYLKEIFIDLSDNVKIQNGYFAVLTLSEEIKTKVSTNRLAGIIKNSVRRNDIAAIVRGGKFCLILPNIDLNGSKLLIEKIQDKIGKAYPIRAGLSKIGIHSFETLEKNANDSLISAIQNNLLTASLDEENQNIDIWLNDDDKITKTQKEYKLFKQAFSKKLENIITPAFFRFQKECETKLTNTQVSQYSNKIESVFCLKNKNLHSELTIHYNGFAKFTIEITHSGLNSAENSKIEIPLAKLTDKYLVGLLRQLRTEFKQSNL